MPELPAWVERLIDRLLRSNPAHRLQDADAVLVDYDYTKVVDEIRPNLKSVQHWIVAWQFIFLFIWWGAASSKLNHHFPFVVSTMMSNAPLIQSRAFKRRLWRDYPEDMRPSRLAAAPTSFSIRSAARRRSSTRARPSPGIR